MFPTDLVLVLITSLGSAALIGFGIHEFEIKGAAAVEEDFASPAVI